MYTKPTEQQDFEIHNEIVNNINEIFDLNLNISDFFWEEYYDIVMTNGASQFHAWKCTFFSTNNILISSNTYYYIRE
ncbi:hypothetical protein [Spiroplasma endosymbiont of Amphibalanus improvisus]|uniref:hypothetical protein n=1 Tax=Spiroplasma endosymbiont of Amphibalanus improvisus TaxID=3066327 RepID=UPI00313CC3EB